jgi:AcrR family transcriptional regulator
MEEQDRRVRRTRRILHEALISLVLEKGYERITVQDILDLADVGRSTFYAHFRDKEALLLSSFDGMRDELRQEIGDAPPGPARPAAVVFAHAHRHRRVYQALCGRQGGNLVYGHLHRLVGDVLREQLRPHLAGADLPVEVVCECYTSAALGLLRWWVDREFPYGPDRLAQMFQALTEPGLRAALGAGGLSTGGGTARARTGSGPPARGRPAAAP